VTFSVDPPLPAGLELDRTSGAITGSPAAPVVNTNRITVTDGSGASASVDLNITVTASPAPAGLTYSNASTRLAPILSCSLVPVIAGGPVTSYAITPVPPPGHTPVLPAGLTLNAVTGAISGVPAIPPPGPSNAQTYGVTATGPGGSTGFHLWLEVDRALTYREMERIYTPGVAMAELRPTNTAHAFPPVIYSILPAALPPGILFNTATGVFQGTPTAPFATHVYRVTAANPGGHVSGDVTITVQNSRLDALAVPFVPVPNTTTPTYRFVDFPTHLRTQEYQTLFLPRAPMFHAYNPLDLAQVRWNQPFIQVQTNLALKFPATFYPALPEPVRARIAALGLARNQVDIFCVSQNLTYDTTDPAAAIIFRPQGWTDPDAPYRGWYNAARSVQVGIFEAEPFVHFNGHAPADFFVYSGISVHTDADAAQAPLIISSDAGPAITGITGVDPGGQAIAVNTSFWTLTQTGTGADSRAAAPAAGDPVVVSTDYGDSDPIPVP
jgi:hypothetical protein